MRDAGARDAVDWRSDGDVDTFEFRRTRRTTYETRGAPASTMCSRMLSKTLPTPTSFVNVWAHARTMGRDKRLHTR